MSFNIKLFIQALFFNMFAFVGVFVKFFPLYIQNQGISHFQMSFIFSFVPMSHVIMTFLTGYFANKFSIEEKIIKIFSLLSFLFSLLYIFSDSWFQNQSNLLFLSFCLITFFISLFRNPIVPILDSVSLKLASQDHFDYGKIKLWASVGFIFGSFLTASLLYLDFFENQDHIILYSMSFFLFLAFLSSQKIHSPHFSFPNVQFHMILPIIKNQYFVLFILSSLFHVVTIASYHAFFSLLIIDSGFTHSFIVVFTLASILSEILALHFSSKIFKYFSSYSLLLALCFLLSAIRWLTLAFFHHNFLLVFLSQILHPFSWGLFYITSIMIVQKIFKTKLQTSGIAFFSNFSIGFGSILGFVIAGFISQYSSYFLLFLTCSFLSFLAFSISILNLNQKSLQN